MEKALAKLKSLRNVYNEIEDVKVGEELSIKLRLLTSEEETSVHSFSVEKFDQGIGFLYAVKRETLCRAIINMNSTDIPDIVEEEKEKIQRHIWIRESIINGWSQIIIDEVWNGYARLMTRIENKISGGLKSEKKLEEMSSEQ